MKLDENTKTLITLYIPSSIVSISQGMVVPTTPALAASFDVQPALAAQVVTANLLGRMLVTLPSGILIDRLGRKPAMIGGPILIVLGSILTVVTPSFALLVAAQLLSGAGAAIWALGREIAAIDLIRPNQRGRVLALFFGINSAGQALGPVIGGVVTDWYGYRAVFLIAMLFSFGVIALSAAIPRDREKACSAHSNPYVRLREAERHQPNVSSDVPGRCPGNVRADDPHDRGQRHAAATRGD